MKTESDRYWVVLLTVDGMELAKDDRNTLSEAKQLASYYLSDRWWGLEYGTTHKDLGTYKVEVRDSRNNDVCVFDKFYQGVK